MDINTATLNSLQSGVSLAKGLDSILAGQSAGAQDFSSLSNPLEAHYFAGIPSANNPMRGIQAASKNQFGDAVLNNVQDFRVKFQETQKYLETMLNNGMSKVGSAELIRLQMKVQELGWTMDLAAKSSDKMSQLLQTLMRNQG